MLVAVDEHPLRAHVAVVHPGRVRGGEAMCKLACPLEGAGGGRRVLERELLGQGPALHVLEGHVVPRVHPPHVEDPDEVRRGQARRGEERVWSGYAGAPAGAASREEIAGGLVAALINHFGDSVRLDSAPFTLAETAPAIRIIEPKEE